MVFGWMVFTGNLGAQPVERLFEGDESHIPLPGFDQEDLRELFAKRLKLRDQFNEDSEMLRKLLREFRNNEKDPKEFVESFLQQHPELRDPQRLKQFQDFARERAQSQMRNSIPPDQFNELKQELEQAEPPPVEPKQFQSANQTDPRQNRAEPPEPRPENRRERKAQRWAEKYLGSASKSPAVQQFIDELSSGDFGKWISDQDWGTLGDWSGWKDEAQAFQGWLKTHVGDRSDWDLPSLSGLDLPAIDLSGSGGGYSGGGGGGFAGPSGGGSWLAVIILGVIGAAGLFAWWYYYRPESERKKGAVGSHSVLGRWPVPPAEVSTREDLVRAFEYLSLARCGDSARMWHHLAMGVGLAQVQPDRSREAMELAELYAHARYAPRHLEMNPGQIATARAYLQDLSRGPAQ